jgi:tetratricopeptide (TPR) repeat protein
MSTNELNSYLNSFDRPQNFNDQAWNQLLEQSRSVWNKFLDGEDWKESLNITCKEAYLMLVNSEGKLIIKDDSLLNYVKNENVKSWIKRVEEIAFKSLRDKRYEIAERYFGKLIKLDPTNAMHYYRRALVRSQLRNQKDALADLTDAININPNISVFYAKRAEMFRLLDVDHKAMSDLNKAIKLNPARPDLYELRGKYRLSLGDRAGGRLDLLRAEELNGDSEGFDSMTKAA